MRVARALCRRGDACVCLAPDSQARTRSTPLMEPYLTKDDGTPLYGNRERIGEEVQRLLAARLGSTRPSDRTREENALPVLMGSPGTGKSMALVRECASFANEHGGVLSAFTMNAGMGDVMHHEPRAEIALRLIWGALASMGPSADAAPCEDLVPWIDVDAALTQANLWSDVKDLRLSDARRAIQQIVAGSEEDPERIPVIVAIDEMTKAGDIWPCVRRNRYSRRRNFCGEGGSQPSR